MISSYVNYLSLINDKLIRNGINLGVNLHEGMSVDELEDAKAVLEAYCYFNDVLTLSDSAYALNLVDGCEVKLYTDIIKEDVYKQYNEKFEIASNLLHADRPNPLDGEVTTKTLSGYLESLGKSSVKDLAVSVDGAEAKKISVENFDALFNISRESNLEYSKDDEDEDEDFDYSEDDFGEVSEGTDEEEEVDNDEEETDYSDVMIDNNSEELPLDEEDEDFDYSDEDISEEDQDGYSEDEDFDYSDDDLTEEVDSDYSDDATSEGVDDDEDFDYSDEGVDYSEDEVVSDEDEDFDYSDDDLSVEDEGVLEEDTDSSDDEDFDYSDDDLSEEEDFDYSDDSIEEDDEDFDYSDDSVEGEEDFDYSDDSTEDEDFDYSDDGNLDESEDIFASNVGTAQSVNVSAPQVKENYEKDAEFIEGIVDSGAKLLKSVGNKVRTSLFSDKK